MGSFHLFEMQVGHMNQAEGLLAALSMGRVFLDVTECLRTGHTATQ